MTSAATEPWWELCVAVPDALVDDAGALLVSEGALGCEQVSADLPAPTFAGATASAGGRPPTRPGESLLVASFPGALPRAEVIERTAAALIAVGLAPPGDWRILRRTDVDWAERWKEHFRPLALGRRLWVVPSWVDAFAAPPGAVVVTLDPGLAFGTGQHATTALCGDILDEGLAESASRPRRLLDVGTGSGILAIAAALLGCEEVLAIDNDPMAVTVAHENVAQNGVGDAVRASGEDLAALSGTYDWVVANIVAPILIELAPALVGHTAPGGALVLSGVLASQQDEVVAAMTEAAQASGRAVPELIARRQRDEWVALRLRC